jgi:DNA-directed RNA polymerase subunit H (RpoH/RPB5)
MDIQLAIRNLIDMLNDRGEDTSSIRESMETMTDTNAFTQQIYDEWKTDKTQLIFALSKNFFNSYVKNYIKDPEIDLIDLYERSHVLVITSEHPSPSVLTSVLQKDKVMQQKSNTHTILQLFTLKELQYNPSKHILVPKHELMKNEADIKELLVKYQIKSKTHLPHIFKTDVMAKWLGLRVGDVIRITRYNENSGIYHYYRCCV